MIEYKYPFPTACACAAIRCPLPKIRVAIDQAQGIEDAANENARLSGDTQEAEAYYNQAKEAKKSTRNS